MRSAKVKLALETGSSGPGLLRSGAAAGVAATAAQPHGWTNPVVPGDHPDPTIVLVGDTYWASSTSGEWSPQFPLFCSEDLVGWTPSGAIFPEQPGWAAGSFWAPELVHDEVTDRCLVWYVGRKRGGPLCIAVATAESPGGPYTDHGPLICEQDGSIDPCFARDEHGAPYLIWKEDGNSQGRPTPIWAQALSDDLLQLQGEKTQLIVNDQPWEGGVVEGTYIFKHAGRFYMFYAGNACCGRECKYAEGVARADRLLGPWEKYPGNPLIGANDRWRCPGHGTAVHAGAGGTSGSGGADYLLYHAYPETGNIFVGRVAVLDEIEWPAQDAAGRTGWPSINHGSGPGEYTPAPAIGFVETFDRPGLGQAWQWPVNTRPEVGTEGGRLRLGIPVETGIAEKPVESALVAVPRPAGVKYQATVGLRVPGEADTKLWAGLAVVGDPFNTIGLGLRGQVLELWQRRGGMQAVLWSGTVPTGEPIWLRSNTVGLEHHLQFSYSADGAVWTKAGEEYDASDLPAWDRALRIGLMLEGPLGVSAEFERFELLAR